MGFHLFEVGSLFGVVLGCPLGKIGGIGGWVPILGHVGGSGYGGRICGIQKAGCPGEFRKFIAFYSFI